MSAAQRGKTTGGRKPHDLGDNSIAAATRAAPLRSRRSNRKVIDDEDNTDENDPSPPRVTSDLQDKARHKTNDDQALDNMKKSGLSAEDIVPYPSKDHCDKYRWFVAQYIRDNFKPELPVVRQPFYRNVTEHHKWDKARQVIAEWRSFDRIEYDAAKALHVAKPNDRKVLQYVLDNGLEAKGWPKKVTNENVNKILVQCGQRLSRYPQRTEKAAAKGTVDSPSKTAKVLVRQQHTSGDSAAKSSKIESEITRTTPETTIQGAKPGKADNAGTLGSTMPEQDRRSGSNHPTPLPINSKLSNPKGQLSVWEHASSLFNGGGKVEGTSNNRPSPGEPPHPTTGSIFKPITPVRHSTQAQSGGDLEATARDIHEDSVRRCVNGATDTQVSKASEEDSAATSSESRLAQYEEENMEEAAAVKRIRPVTKSAPRTVVSDDKDQEAPASGAESDSTLVLSSQRYEAESTEIPSKESILDDLLHAMTEECEAEIGGYDKGIAQIQKTRLEVEKHYQALGRELERLGEAERNQLKRKTEADQRYEHFKKMRTEMNGVHALQGSK